MSAFYISYFRRILRSACGWVNYNDLYPIAHDIVIFPNSFLKPRPLHSTLDVTRIDDSIDESRENYVDKILTSFCSATLFEHICRQACYVRSRRERFLKTCVLVHLGETIEAKTYPDVTMLFSDIVGFTAICATATPMMVINMLQNLYEQFDLYCGQLDVYKVRYEVRVTKYIKDAFDASLRCIIYMRHFFLLITFITFILCISEMLSFNRLNKIHRYRENEVNGIEAFREKLLSLCHL